MQMVPGWMVKIALALSSQNKHPPPLFPSLRFAAPVTVTQPTPRSWAYLDSKFITRSINYKLTRTAAHSFISTKLKKNYIYINLFPKGYCHSQTVRALISSHDTWHPPDPAP